MNNNQYILITGGTGKLGRLFVEHFLLNDFNVIFTSRSEENVRELKQRYTVSGSTLTGIVLDMESDGGVDYVIDYIKESRLYPTVVINSNRNIANLKLGSNGEVSRENWNNELLLNVVVPYELSQKISKLEPSQLKTIINVASMYGVVAVNPSLYQNPIMESPIHYGVIKAAMIHLTKELAVRLAPKGINVNAISYGGLEGRSDDAFKKRYASLCPCGKMLSDQDVIGAMDFLISDKASGITGHNLVVDGGWSIW